MTHAIKLILILLTLAMTTPAGAAEPAAPNFIIIFADDLGYGDLGCFGHPTIRTPRLDRMAAEGLKLTQFYSAAAACSPSRAALLTGRYPLRTGVPRVLNPNSPNGLSPEEITLARALKDLGYATACIGKWHLGHGPQFRPTSHGFDEYFGVPWSNDQNRQAPPHNEPPVPLMRNSEIIEQPVDQTTLTRRYTEEALRFIRAHKDGPFFLYLAHTFPHVPLFAGEDFAGRSPRGTYGDVVEELDWSVGEILRELGELELAGRTLVIFTSDNGPWLIKELAGGSSGPLREGKGTAWEGGFRVPAIAWWPGQVPAGATTTAFASTLDLFPTLLGLAGGTPPADRIIDGVDLAEVLHGRSQAGREELAFHYHDNESTLFAYRLGPWKAHFITQARQQSPREPQDPPQLYNLEWDPSERHDLAADHPEVLAAIRTRREMHEAKLPVN